MISEENARCRCCKECQGFRKILNLNNTGLTIYHYSSNVNKGVPEINDLKKAESSGDVYIIHNTSSFDISKEKYMSELAQYTIKCPRCKYIFEQAKKILKKKKQMNKFEITGVCKHCLAMNRLIKPCTQCCEAINNFFYFKNQVAKEIREFVMLKKLKDYLEFLKVPCSLKHRSLSEFYLHKTYDMPLMSKFFSTPRVDQYFDFRNLRKTHQIEDDPPTHSKLESSLKNSDYEIKQSSNNDDTSEDSDVDFDTWLHKKIRFPYEHTSGLLNALDLSNLQWKHLLRKKLQIYSPYKYNKNASDSRDWKTENTLSEAEYKLKQSSYIKQKDKNDNLGKFNVDQKFIPISKISPHEDFDFFFIKKSKKDQSPFKKYKSSAELIRDTQNMIQEREKKRQANTEKLIRKDVKYVDESKTLTSKKESQNILLTKETGKLIFKKPLNKKEIDKDYRKYNIVPKTVQSNKTLGNAEMQSPNKIKEQLEKSKDTQKQKVEKSKEKNDKIEAKNKQQPFEKKNQKHVSIEKQQQSDKEKRDNESYLDSLKKMMIEQKRQKEEELRLKKNQEENINKHKHITEHKNIVDTKTEINEKRKDKKGEKKNYEDSKLNEVVIQKPSPDDLILQLVQLKQSDPQKTRVRPKRLSEINVNPRLIAVHKNHKYKKLPNCIICNDSELELDIENIALSKAESMDVSDIIIGQKIIKYKPNVQRNNEDVSLGPTFFTVTSQDNNPGISIREGQGDVKEKVLSPKKARLS